MGNVSAAVLGLVLGAGSALAAPASIVDHSFADGDWSVVPFVTGDGGLVEAMQTSTGNPAPSRRVHNVVNASPSATESSVIWGVHLYAGQTYDPSTQGPFTNLDYFEDALLVQGFGDGQATGMALRQAGAVYVRQVGGTPAFNWTTKQDRGVPATSFVRIVDGGFDGGSHPDFSVNGGSIEFGFFRANSTSPGANGYQTVALIDNWAVLVNTPCTLDAECVYPDGCFLGTCVAGTCQATLTACDDGNVCTTDFCAGGSCATAPVVCDDGDACTTDSCGTGGCSAAPIDCDDDLPCTVDACSAGTCLHGLDFVTIQNAIDGLLALLDTPPCAGDGVVPRTRKKLVKRLVKAHARLGLADEATKAALVTRFVGKADHLLDVATRVLDKASDGGKISPACAASVASYLASLLTCTDALPTP